MAVRTVEVTISGITALLMHRYPMEPPEALDKKPAEEQAEVAAYRMPDGTLYLPGINLQRAMISAAVFSKGKGRASLQKTAAACLMVTPEMISLGTSQYVIDSRPVVIPSTKGRIVRHRPRIDQWQATFMLEYDDALLKESEVNRIVADTGQRIGVLDFRPERKGPFGRFMVTGWKIVG